MKTLSQSEMEAFTARHPKAIARMVQRRSAPRACSDEELRLAIEDLERLTTNG